LYSEAYGRLYQLHEKAGWQDRAAGERSKAQLVRLFRKELEGKPVLDVGCGTGTFLRTIYTNLEHKALVGIDLSAEVLPDEEEHIEFIRGNVIDFKMDKKFDVAFSDNVVEHIASDDLSTHLLSIKNALKPGGTLIVITPNRLFGPSDITVIVDSTYTNRVGALGMHLNETTYSENAKQWNFTPASRCIGPGRRAPKL
jgi:2-polyprenyl-3-methyl-5-hydroxy-6-metoxy-1,4-benzoquinol methylase